MSRIKNFFSEISPHTGFGKMTDEVSKVGLKGLNRSDKVALGGFFGAPYAGGMIGAGVGAFQDGEGTVSSMADKGFQAGGVASAAAIAGSPLARKSFGRVGMSALIGGAMTTMSTALMQDEDAGVLQRLGVNFASLGVGMVGGGLLAKGSMKLGMFTKSVT